MSRAHAFLSASGAARWIACPPSAKLSEQYEDTGSDYAAQGTDAHTLAEYKVLEMLGKHPKDPRDSLKYLDAEMEECTDQYAAYVAEVLTEVKEDCKDPIVMVETQVDFSTWVPEGFGTADCIIVGNGILHIIDFKFGLGVLVEATDNSQLKFVPFLNEKAVQHDDVGEVLPEQHWGFGPGIMASFVLSLLQLLLDGAYAWGWQSMIGDYLLAFTVLGSAGLFKSRKNGFYTGMLTGAAARFAVAWVTGAVVWGEYMPDEFFGMKMSSPWLYSALYNGSYILLSLLLCIAAGMLLMRSMKKYILGEDISFPHK